MSSAWADASPTVLTVISLKSFQLQTSLQLWTVQKTSSSPTLTPPPCASPGTVRTVLWHHTASSTPALRRASESCVRHPEVSRTACCSEASVQGQSTLSRSSPCMTEHPANLWWERRPQVWRHKKAVILSSLIAYIQLLKNHGKHNFLSPPQSFLLHPAWWSQTLPRPLSPWHGERRTHAWLATVWWWRPRTSMDPPKRWMLLQTPHASLFLASW